MKSKEKIKKELIIRNYQEGDEYGILDLFKDSFNKKMNISFWKWRYANNPWDNEMISLAIHKNKIIGHYAVCPVAIKDLENIEMGALSMTTMTHPNYRGMGIFPLLAKNIYDICRKKDYFLIYGFPNEMSYEGFVQKLGWVGAGKMKIYQFESQDIDLNNSKNHEINEIKGKVPECSLFDKNKLKSDFSIIRDEKYYNWRFINSPSKKRYSLYFIEENNKIRGIFVLKVFNNGNERIGHIIDWFIEDSLYFEAIINFSKNFFFKKNIPKFSLWAMENQASRYNLQLLSKSTHMMESTYFGYKILSQKIPSKKLDYKNFYICMGDSDVF